MAQSGAQSRAGSGQKTRIVMKFGGTSVANIERINAVAARVKREVDAGHEVAVVVSAMSGHTNQLVAWCSEISPMHDAREYDTVVASGEQVTAGLTAIALQNLGINARSWLGWQMPLSTNDAHGKARILSIDAEAFEQRFAQGQVAVVAGFQGIGPDNRITTLGRGGSDTSAVALAAALKADRCDIFTDVDGVYTTDPRIVAKARKLDKVTYEEMLEMASLGAKVLQIRSVELAMKYNVPIHVRSSFNDNEGTWVVMEDASMEHVLVSGVTADRNEAKITLLGVPDRPGIAARVLKPLAEKGIVVDMIIQNVSADGKTDMTFTVPKGDLKRARELCIAELPELADPSRVRSDENIAKVSVVGAGMRSHAGVAQQMFELLARESINIQMISTSEIKISVVIEAKYAELAVRTLHDGFKLDQPPESRNSELG